MLCWFCLETSAELCASVPKDYFNASAGTATIALGRRRARKLPKRGSVMTNPGRGIVSMPYAQSQLRSGA